MKRLAQACHGLIACFFVVIFAAAPIPCIEFCKLLHQLQPSFAQHTHTKGAAAAMPMHGQHESASRSAQPTPLEMQRMLLALVELVIPLALFSPEVRRFFATNGFSPALRMISIQPAPRPPRI